MIDGLLCRTIAHVVVCIQREIRQISNCTQTLFGKFIDVPGQGQRLFVCRTYCVLGAGSNSGCYATKFVPCNAGGTSTLPFVSGSNSHWQGT
jgi:hypothetical protein